MKRPADIFDLLIPISIILLVVLGNYSQKYIKKVHPDTWKLLGDPHFWSSANLGRWDEYLERVRKWLLFTFITSEHLALRDAKLSAILWTVRGLMIAIPALFVAQAIHLSAL